MFKKTAAFIRLSVIIKKLDQIPATDFEKVVKDAVDFINEGSLNNDQIVKELNEIYLEKTSA